jgi:ribonucleoside-diphosphate reductase alpha chain
MYTVIKRGGQIAQFDSSKILNAIEKAFIASKITEGNYPPLIAKVVEAELASKFYSSTAIPIEEIQNQIEETLMAKNFFCVAKNFIIYRNERAKQRIAMADLGISKKTMHVKTEKGNQPLDLQAINNLIVGASHELEGIDANYIIKSVVNTIYDGVTIEQVLNSIILSARTKIEENPDYSNFSARILLHILKNEVFFRDTTNESAHDLYREGFEGYINKGVEVGRISKDLQQFDLKLLARSLDASRDFQFDYLGLQTLYDRYLLQDNDKRFELPQWLFMRVAMGLSLNEDDKNARAIEFYNLLSQFYFMSSTPTLFNAGTLRPQLSSCYLTTIGDDLGDIYDGLKENALLSKWAGGLGNDWTNVRALGSRIKGTNGKSQGVIPFLKVANDTLVACNQGGKRLGSGCAYLETWHLDIEEFLELRKNTGDDRRRCHDMNSANWIPDLFMKRVMEKGTWTLFSPSDVPDLHDLYGKEFEWKYKEYERAAKTGVIKLYKQVNALDLWRRMLTMLFETGHPWITFKDPCNIRSPQNHVGVVHSSNLCSEITLNTNHEEIAVCNLGSVNLVKHLKKDANGSYHLDLEQLQKTIKTAMRMLDNVIDINYYAIEKARTSNTRHRPVGLGLMGFQDCLHLLNVSYAGEEALEFADASTEAVCYYAYQASSDLAVERGVYSSYQGSLWQRGVLPLDSLAHLAKERGGYLEYNQTQRLDWNALRDKIQSQGMRNSNCVAIAPTATISNIIGVSACIEPTYQNLYVKSNLSGEFTIINSYLVKTLKALGLWDSAMITDLKCFDGSLQQISRIPQEIKDVYATAFEVDASWIVQAAARRQKWIDQAQSLNIYLAGASGKKLDEVYKQAWLSGLKTTYYLRTMGATHAEKSTIHTGALNAVQSNLDEQPKACYLKPGDAGFEECEACQ